MVKAVAMLSVFGLGMCFALLGSLSVKLMPRLKIDQGKFGSLISGFMFSCLVASLIIGVAIDKIGYQPIAVIGFILVAICIFILARGQTYNSVLLPCILLGFGAMALNTAGNVLGPQVLYEGNPAAASNLLNVFFGLGLFLTPMIVSFLFRKTSYENSVSVLAAIALAPVVLALLAKYPETPAGFEIGDAFGLLAEPAVLVAAFVLFCYIALEVSFCNWLPSFGKEVIKTETPDMEDGAADASAQRLLSLFAIAMMAGRLGASQIEAITKYGSYVIAGAAVVAGVAIVLMMQTKNRSMAQILAVLSGLAFAPCFPTTIGVTFSKFDSSIYGSIFGIIFAVGLAGAVIIPKAIGNLAKGSSIQKSLKLLLPACALLLVLALVLGPLDARSDDVKPKPEVKKVIDDAKDQGKDAAGQLENEGETLKNEGEKTLDDLKKEGEKAKEELEKNLPKPGNT
ncbi:MAG: MFS transporter [Deltaproteobacteria bacterium]|nr:MFS transporter [Deltaproteobacteria bacterium]